MQSSKSSTILMRGEQPKNMKKQYKSGILMYKCEAPKSVKSWVFARFAQWLIWPCLAPRNDPIKHDITSTSGRFVHWSTATLTLSIS